jgi:hypothetical protein
MRYVLAPLTAIVVCLAAAQLVTATDISNTKTEAAIDIAALTRTAGTLPVTAYDAI